MQPLALVFAALGVLGLVAAILLLRTLGPRFRLGRILSAAPQVSLEEARELAASRPVYVRVSGRISSTEEFPDDNDRPLVFRRTRLDVQVAPERWRTVLDEREAVPFGVESRSAFVALDQDALGDGLVAIPRIATGRAGELHGEMADAAAGVAPETPVRMTIEQLSAVEHVTACGTPELRDGEAVLTAGLGRPLIVTALDQPAAMRVLASGGRRRVATAAVLIAAGLALVALAIGLAVLATAMAAPVLAASPSPPAASPSPVPSPVIGVPTDPRAGGGAPLVGAPGLALLVVVLAGLVAALATIAYVRLTGAKPPTRPANRR